MFDLDRRTLMKGMTAATALAGQSLKASAAELHQTSDYVIPRGQNGRFVRFPDLNLESYHDLLGGYIKWKNETYIPLYRARATQLFKAAGSMNPDKPTICRSSLRPRPAPSIPTPKQADPRWLRSSKRSFSYIL